MSAVVLDSTPLGLICHPRRRVPEAVRCRHWVRQLLANGRRVILPEITDYEYRRTVLRRQEARSQVWLREWRRALEFVPIQPPVMELAAGLWADIRRMGLATAGDEALDCDVILAAQAINLNVPVIVATSNVKHIGRFVAAERWELIAP